MTGSPFPLSRWFDPSFTGLGRWPITGGLDPFDDATTARSGQSPWRRSLAGEWAFHLAASPDDVTVDHVAGPVDDWESIAVPSSWVFPGGPGRGTPIYLNVRMPFDGQPPHVPADNPTGVHRRRFRLDRPWRERRTLLHIGAVNSMCWAWVDGHFVGASTDSHLAATFDITAQLAADVDDHDVAIVVPRWSAATWIEDQDQWWMPGLHRSVELISLPRPVAIGDAALVPGLRIDDDAPVGTLAIDVTVAGPADVGDLGVIAVRVQVESLDDDAVLAATTIEVPRWDAGSGHDHGAALHWPGRRTIATLDVAGIRPWNHERPQRYRAIVELLDAADDVVDVRTTHVGFRSVEIADRALLINGEPVLINGINHHDIDPDRGPATTADDTRRDLELMKRHHVNAVRTSHYPPDEVLLELCDELGLYVVDEADIETHARWRAIADDPAYAAAFLTRGIRMVQRDRSHPSVIAWSLGNESGYGPSHDAMAAWIRRVDPSRPLHYEGGFTLDLDAANPVSDLVCPMYASVERITEWSRAGVDRRPLILCEYNHAMGQAGGLADYWHAFHHEDGLQGGFVWEWADHGLRRVDDDGTEWFAYGGDFGEADHDSRFVCDGLVSPDRVPHPLLDELAALTQPVAVSWSDDGRLAVTNRRHFTNLDDLVASWTVERDGVAVDAGELELPTIDAGATVLIDVPGEAIADAPGRTTATFTWRWRDDGRPVWAHGDDVVAVTQVDLPSTAATPPTPPLADGSAITVDDDGIEVGGHRVGWPALCLWRAPTDNDDPPGSGRPTPAAAETWRAHGLDVLSPSEVSVDTAANGTWTRLVRYAAAGSPIEHRQRVVTRPDGALEITDDVVIDAAITDLPRVGITLAVPDRLRPTRWRGLGPGDSYPDRRAAVRYGVWDFDEQPLPFVVPQDYGLRLDTEWLELASDDLVVRFAATVPLAMSALPWSDAALTSAAHAHELVADGHVHVHVDVAHRGLGTFACGPDTHPRFRLGGGAYSWTWTLSARSFRGADEEFTI